jgi:hypothetical protein
MYLKETEYEGVDWIQLAQNTTQRQDVVISVKKLPVP